jgi:hypothetical protein
MSATILYALLFLIALALILVPSIFHIFSKNFIGRNYYKKPDNLSDEEREQQSLKEQDIRRRVEEEMRKRTHLHQ